MRAVNSATSDYLASRNGIVARRFVYVFAKNRSTGETEEIGFWNGLQNVSVSVISGQTGLAVSRDYIAAGSLLDVSNINLVSDLTLQTVRIKLSKINADAVQAIRGYDARNAKIEVHFGLFNTATRALVDTPYPHFVGQVNKSPIPTPKPGSEGSITIEAVSRARELTIRNAAKKSDETQRLRSDDRFRRYSSTAHLWSIFWGEEKA